MIDETHQFARKKSNAAEVFIELRGALTKRPDGFLFQTTTQMQGDRRPGCSPPSWRWRARCGTARCSMPLLPGAVRASR